MAEEQATTDTVDTTPAPTDTPAPEAAPPKARKPRAKKAAAPKSDTATPTETTDEQPSNDAATAAPKKRAPRKKATSVESVVDSSVETTASETATTKPKRAAAKKPAAKRTKKTAQAADEPVNTDAVTDPAPTIAVADADIAPTTPHEADIETDVEPSAPTTETAAQAEVTEAPTELTEASKRKRATKASPAKPRSKSSTTKTTPAITADNNDADKPADPEATPEKPENNEADGDGTQDQPTVDKRRTAANARTAAPRTRKTIKAEADDAGDAKPKARGTKSTPKPRARKPVAVPDPDAPAIEDERPLVMQASDVITESSPSDEDVVLTEATKRVRKPRAKAAPRTSEPKAPIPTPTTAADAEPESVVAEPATEPSVASAEKTTESAPVETSPSAHAAAATEPTTPSPAPSSTVIETVEVPTSSRTTVIVLFLVVALIGLGGGWLIGRMSGTKPVSTTITPTTVSAVPSATNPAPPSSDISSSLGASTGGKELFSLSGTGARQGALFDLPAGTVTLHYDSTGGTFNAKLLPEGGSDGTVFDCTSACNKEQAIAGPPGRYYFDVQSSGGGNWFIRLTE